MSPEKKPLTKSEVILDCWEHIKSNSVGVYELELLQKKLEDKLGRSGDISPASIARTLADAGVRLRHPEVLEADRRWREGRMTEFFGPDEIAFDTLDSAFDSIVALEGLRRQFLQERYQIGIKRLFEYGRELKKRQELQTGSILAEEVAQWLSVWLQTPELLKDWLELRRKSADFAQKFRT